LLRCLSCVDLLREDGVLALLLDLICPSSVEPNVVFILLEHKQLTAALRGKEAFVLCSPLEEAGDVIWTDPVTAARRCDEQLAILLFTSANYAALL
jgi:hypothetical protein